MQGFNKECKDLIKNKGFNKSNELINLTEKI